MNSCNPILLTSFQKTVADKASYFVKGVIVFCRSREPRALGIYQALVLLNCQEFVQNHHKALLYGSQLFTGTGIPRAFVKYADSQASLGICCVRISRGRPEMGVLTRSLVALLEVAPHPPSQPPLDPTNQALA